MTMISTSDDGAGHISLLDIVVLIAMVVTALAFAAALIVKTGIDPMAGGIAAAALFLVMASSHFAITRASRPAADSGRLDEIEEALILLDRDLQRIDQVEDDVARLDLLTDRVERLDRAVSEGGGGGTDEGSERLERITTDLERLNQQLEILRSEFESETRSQRDQIGAELRSLEVAIKDLSREVIASPAFAAAAAAEGSERTAEIPLRFAPTEAVGLDLGEGEAADLTPDADDDIIALLVEETTLDLGAEEEKLLDLAEIDTVSPASSGSLTERLAEAFAIDDDAATVKQAIEAGRIDLYVAPIVTLPSRKLRYFDATARLRGETDDVLPAANSLQAAEREHLLSRIDNAMLVKSVQLLRRLGADETLSGVFCPLSLQSLSDEDYFPELVDFLEENSVLGDSLIFQLDQGAIGDLGRDELAGLKILGRLGFCFALDGVTSLEADYAALRDHFFRFVKIDADRLLDGGTGPVASRDMASHLDRFDLKLVADNVESEHGLSWLMEIGVELAEGALFASPRPANAALFRELEETGAAKV